MPCEPLRGIVLMPRQRRQVVSCVSQFRREGRQRHHIDAGTSCLDDALSPIRCSRRVWPGDRKTNCLQGPRHFRVVRPCTAHARCTPGSGVTSELREQRPQAGRHDSTHDSQRDHGELVGPVGARLTGRGGPNAGHMSLRGIDAPAFDFGHAAPRRRRRRRRRPRSRPRRRDGRALGPCGSSQLRISRGWLSHPGSICLPGTGGGQ